MSRAARLALFWIAAIGAGALGIPALFAIPPFGSYQGPYGDLVNAAGVAERHITNMVTAVTFDYRGFDTLGEEYILFAAVTGILVLLRGERGTREDAPPGGTARRRNLRQRSEAVIAGSRWFVAFVVLFGLYVVLHAVQTPGGGFQGGAILGTASLLFYFAEGYAGWRHFTPHHALEVAKSVGAAGFAAVGLAALPAGGTLLENVLPLGGAGDLVSGGTIWAINLCVALEVAAGFALLFSEFLEETRRGESHGRHGHP